MPHPSRTSLRPPVVARRDARPSRARPRRSAALVLLAMALLLAPPHRLAAATPDDPTRVLIVYNTAMADWDGDGVPDSLQVAQYYAAKRHVPAGNLLAVTCSSPNMYDPNVADGQWANVVAEVIRPIKDKLAQLGPRNIDTILLSYGMPYAFRGWEMSLDNALMGINAWSESGDDVVWSTNPYCETTPTFGSDHGRFDHALYGFGGDMYLVARLDGPRGVAGVLELIDQALYGDRYVSALPGYYHGIS